MGRGNPRRNILNIFGFQGCINIQAIIHLLAMIPTLVAGPDAIIAVLYSALSLSRQRFTEAAREFTTNRAAVDNV